MVEGNCFRLEGAMSRARTPLELPKDNVFYFKDGRVEGTTHYCEVNQTTIAKSTYRRWGDKYFVSHFDEHHRVYTFNVETPLGRLPEDVREMFQAGNRDGVARLRKEGKLTNSVDSN